MIANVMNPASNASTENGKTAIQFDCSQFIIGMDDPILITGAGGFIGSRLVESLLSLGFRNLRCLARPSSKMVQTGAPSEPRKEGARIEVVKGNLLSFEDCTNAARDVAVIFHLAAGRGEKSYPDAFMNSAVTTRNLLEASLRNKNLKRFVNVSSFTVYTNTQKSLSRLLDEGCPVEAHPELRGEAYCFAKVKQDEIVSEYGTKYSIPYVIVRPGFVFGPGNLPITGRVGIDTFGVFLHLGGSNKIPFTYVDNCADAIALAGLKSGINGEVFNVVDDDLPSSRHFLRLYKKNVRTFRSLYIPHGLSYTLCYLWERMSRWSEGQLPPAFNRRRWRSQWKKTRYSNEKLKDRVGWTPRVTMAEGLNRYFKACRDRGLNA
jgi:nucleoside-diphosphate-sugar epimerase